MVTEPGVSKDARVWLTRVLELFARHAPLRSFCLEDGSGEIVLLLDLDGVEVSLSVRPRDEQAAWRHTRSLSLSITSDTPHLPRQTEQHLLALASIMDRADPGVLTFPNQPRAPVRFRGRSSDRGVREHEQSADALRFAAYVAWRALTSADLYPHIRPLGDLVSDRELLDGWERTVSRVRDGTAPDKVGLYVHVPFCAAVCTFCCCGRTDRFNRQGFDRYVDGLVAEMEQFSPVFDRTKLTSIYFGGGTPSLLPVPALERVLGTLRRSFDIADGTQIIFEGNPDSLSEQKIEVLAKVGGVTRLTVGVQTLDAEAQLRARRFNRPEQVSAAVASAKKHGITHVNVDLMVGLDGQSLDSFRSDLEFVLSLGPDSVHINAFRPQPWTSYSLSGRSMSDEQVRLRDEMLAWGTQRLQGGGYSHLDQGQGKTANAANIQDYDLRKRNGSLLGLGIPARSHSFAAHYYEPDVPEGDIDAALRADREGRLRRRAVPVDDAGERQAYLVHNLHTGFSLSEFRALWGTEPAEVHPDGWDKLERLGVITCNGDRVESDCGDHAGVLIYRVLLYSDEVAERVQRVWGPEYDRAVDYAALLRRMCERQSEAVARPR